MGWHFLFGIRTLLMVYNFIDFNKRNEEHEQLKH